MVAANSDGNRPHVLVATDANFAMPTAVTLRSVGMYGLPAFDATVLHAGISDSLQGSIEASVSDLDVNIRWFDASKLDPGATTKSHLPIATYFRLWATDSVPKDVKRILYLDVDIIVRSSIAELFTCELQGHAIAAVRSVHYPSIGTRGACDSWRKVAANPRAPFFNAGVLVIDREGWEAQTVAERALDYLRSEHCGRGADQEALNVALDGAWSELSPRWNQQTPLLTDTHGAHLIHSDAEITAARDNPVIVHFQTRPKPWQDGCEHPFTGQWWQIAQQTAFDPIAVEKRSLADEWRWRIRRAASALIRGR